MYFERLNEQNVEQYIAYLKLAMQQEPDMMTVEEIDEEGIRTRLRDFMKSLHQFLRWKIIRWQEELSIIFMGVCRVVIAWRM